MRRFVVVVAILLFAGCVTPPPVEDDPAGTISNVLPWQLTECRYIVGWSEADPAVVQQNLPEGFTVSSGGPLGLAGDVVSRAIIGTEAFECASGSGLTGTVEPMTYSSIWIPVTPPEELADPDIDTVYYKIHVLVPDAPRREAMAALGLSVGNGEIAWTQPPVPNSLGSAFRIEGAGDFAFDLLAPRDVGASDGFTFMEITPGEAGYAIWKATFAWDGETYQQGRGTITWPADHWVTDAIGAQTAPGSFHAGVWSFNGTLELPTTTA